MDINYAQETNVHQVLVPCIVFFIVSPFLVGTRLWSRMRKGGRLGPADYTVLAALMFSLSSGGILIAACEQGYGRHWNTLTPFQQRQSLKLFYHSQYIYKACINLTKTSILLLYLRIFNKVKWFRWTCIGLIFIVNFYCIASVVITIFQCHPVQRAWDRSIDGSCIDNGKFWYANAGYSITTDLIILCVPMPLVKKLQIPKVQKAALSMVFMLGVFVVITSCLRVTTIDVQAKTPDKTYDISSTMWTAIEMNVAIVCACLPQIRPLIIKMFPRLMPGSYRNERSGFQSPWSPWPNSGFSKAFSSPAKSCESRWPQHDTHDAIQLSSLRRPETGSEEYILSEDKTSQTLNIQKTVRYSVEYSKDQDRPSLG